MSSALAAQASGSPPGSLTTWAATRDGRIRVSPSSSVKFSISPTQAAISSVSTARAARAAGIRAEARSGVSARLCRIWVRSLALAAKNMSLISAASFGCIDRFDAIRICASVGGLTVGAAAGLAGISSATGTRRPGCCGFSPSRFRTSGGVAG